MLQKTTGRPSIQFSFDTNFPVISDFTGSGLSPTSLSALPMMVTSVENQGTHTSV